MLVLTRKEGESIIVGDQLIQFKILASNAYQVRIGIAAPKNLSIYRKEIYHPMSDGTDRSSLPTREKKNNTGRVQRAIEVDGNRR